VSVAHAGRSGSPAALLGVGHALRRLRVAVSLEALFNQATYALCEILGFERAVFFSVRGNALVAESVYARGAHEAARQRLEHVYPEPLQLGPWLHEAEALRRQRALRVEGPEGDARALAALPGTPSYVTAPVVCEEQALGLVYADRGTTGEHVDELDRATLSAFVEGFGHAVEHGVLAERLRMHSEQVLAFARSTEASITQLGAPRRELPAASGRFSPTPSRPLPDRDLLELLTRRESEVLVMLSEGETNAAIARRLVVSEDTVKTHVKHILRKLGVQNRSQAVSRYFRTHEGPAGRPAAPVRPGQKDAPFWEQESPLGPTRLGGPPV
jgi:LuxR family transcriptional regulator, regulator of acetate metabolism